MSTEPSQDTAPPAEHWRSYGPLDLHPILVHAMEAFNEHGYHGTSVRDIAGRVGVTVPALYYHYENKQALLATLLETSIKDVLDRCRAAAGEAGDDPLARLCGMVESIVLSMAHRRQLAFLDTEIRSLEPQNRARYVALRDYLEHMLLNAVEAGRAQGVFTTPIPADAVRSVLTMCQGVANWFRADGPLTAEEVAERHVLLCLGTVGHPGTVTGDPALPFPRRSALRSSSPGRTPVSRRSVPPAAR
ncbi:MULTISPECIES: TetR/AcrR family transcriptional regulator [unclassified Streptomyces]|uniref:TetR/AcrR family transcriptional regulator n=1 Tax=unclassified Streptomyces TaxID=2593676 RepID=UPI0001C1B08E|nr:MULTISPECIES: TetR/AcrR family transcriptional regulator [unclassified Streptomyces]AEN13927.1 transcriptional regulator, TetR family [Streptomyces sp. SirexAA-E]PZX37557.1 TetR family transcriptional regulator [Streptomyces sp. DvalAA-21]RAJ33750.1 TetR family transcriptional regulator [Streptomyces sp. DpondAA-E10]RAJ48310.1 TetR family transcriptional regulator [Streptomyces sp. DpondAA-A50]SCD69250.1 transcriptional regulator, TetR family [Streptomyces sp. DpondAA-F4a]